LQYICNMASGIRSNQSDKYGIFSAVLCIIHCTILPFALALLTSFESSINGFSYLIDTAFIVVSVSAVYFSARHSTSNAIKASLWFSVLIFVTGVVIEHATTYGKVVALGGSLGLIVAHFFNLRHCRKTHFFNVKA
jgi:hypothetical protein